MSTINERILTKTRKVSMRLPEELIELLDIVASIEFADRTELVKRALKNYMDSLLQNEQFKETVVNYYLEGKISFKQLERILGKEDASAIKASKELLDQGELLAQRIAKNRH